MADWLVLGVVYDPSYMLVWYFVFLLLQQLISPYTFVVVLDQRNDDKPTCHSHLAPSAGKTLKYL
jgi:hypothetical protein